MTMPPTLGLRIILVEPSPHRHTARVAMEPQQDQPETKLDVRRHPR